MSKKKQHEKKKEYFFNFLRQIIVMLINLLFLIKMIFNTNDNMHYYSNFQ
jgi:hypothetical protein